MNNYKFYGIGTCVRRCLGLCDVTQVPTKNGIELTIFTNMHPLLQTVFKVWMNVCRYYFNGTVPVVVGI